MRRLAAIFALLITAIGIASADVVVTVNVKSLTKQPITGRAYVQFDLINCTAAPTVPDGILDLSRYTQYDTDVTTGNVTATLYRNDNQVSCDGAFVSLTRVSVYSQGKRVWTRDYKFQDPTADLATYAPFTSNPPSPPGAATVGPLASRPAPSSVGRLYCTNDTGDMRCTRDNGVSWTDTKYSWAWIDSKPSTFPPSAHTHTVSEVFGAVSTLPAGDQTIAQPGGTRFRIVGDFDVSGTLYMGILQPSALSTTGSFAGAIELGQGPLPAIPANAIQHTAPTSVVGYQVVWPGAAGSGLLNCVNASNTETCNWLTNNFEVTTAKNGANGYIGADSGGKVPLAALGATGTPSNATFFRGDRVWATPAGGGTMTGLGISAVAGPVCANGSTTDLANCPSSVAPGGGFFSVIIHPSYDTGTASTHNGASNIDIYGFVLPAPATITAVTAFVVTGVAATTGDLCLYDESKNLVANTGGFSTATSASWINASLAQGTVTLKPGYYYLGYTNTSASVFMRGSRLGVTTVGDYYNMANGFNGSTYARTNIGSAAGVTGGICPASFTTITPNQIASPVLAFWGR